MNSSPGPNNLPEDEDDVIGMNLLYAFATVIYAFTKRIKLSKLYKNTFLQCLKESFPDQINKFLPFVDPELSILDSLVTEHRWWC